MRSALISPIVSDDLLSNLCCCFRFYETKNLQIPDGTTELTGALDLDALTALAGYAENGYVPVKALFPPDAVADLSIVFISANRQVPSGNEGGKQRLTDVTSVQYGQACEDPVFAATTLSPPDAIGQSYYDPSQYVSPLACAEQFRFCNPNNNICSTLKGYYELFEDELTGTYWPNNDLNKYQIATYQRISDVMERTTIYNAIATRGRTIMPALHISQC